MKKSDYYNIKDNQIQFLESGNAYPVEEFKGVDVRIKPVLKNTVATILNATANAMSSSMANGNEKALIIVDVKFKDHKEEVVMNKEPLTRGNLDYYEMMEHAKKLKKAIKKDMGIV